MTAHYQVLPVTRSAASRAFAALLAFATYWSGQVARARRHRREAVILARLDHRMLADIGLTRSDVRDAFSEPFWEDPTAILRERALERHWNRALTRADIETRVEEVGFSRPRTDRSSAA
jgi:uncharacterized protein YjiS (DUF1127 family)